MSYPDLPRPSRECEILLFKYRQRYSCKKLLRLLIARLHFESGDFVTLLRVLWQ